MNQSFISCPDCSTQIAFEPLALVRGERFGCPGCGQVSIGLDVGSRQLVQETMDELKNVKQSLLKQPENAG